MKTIGVMARAPVPGRCKTRLGASIGAARACALYRAMLFDTLAAIEASFDARLVVLAAPEDDGVAVLGRLVGPRWEVVAQRGEGLGERLANALGDLAAGGGVALVASDSPTAPWEAAARAFASLEERGVLLGPCDDGGYWLIASAEPERRLFEGIAWSTPSVAAETRARCAELGLSCTDLAGTYDVDDARDVERLARDVARDPARAPRTHAVLTAKIVAVVPALDEEDSIGEVVRGVSPYVDAVVVVDNGSRDRTADVARDAGAVVEREARRGYGAACATGVRKARELGAGVVLFLDGDGSDDPSEAPLLLEPVARGEAELVLGIRTARSTEPGAMAPVQRFGNWLAPRMMRVVVGARYRDMPPFKAITMSALERLDLRDPGMGYIIEMLLKADAAGLRVREVEVRCRARRAGRSKISGTVRGTLRASAKITSAILRHAVVQRFSKNPWRAAASRSDA